MFPNLYLGVWGGGKKCHQFCCHCGHIGTEKIRGFLDGGCVKISKSLFDQFSRNIFNLYHFPWSGGTIPFFFSIFFLGEGTYSDKFWHFGSDFYHLRQTKIGSLKGGGGWEWCLGVE